MIYILEDDDSIRELVVYSLNSAGLPAAGFARPSEFWPQLQKELPQLLILGDALIEHTAITLNRDRKQRFNQGTMRLDGHIRGHVAGFVDGEFKGILHGSVDALIESKYQEPATPEQEEHTP